jgi:hypothetical protein
VKSRINERFLKPYRDLPADVRTQARKAYRLFAANPNHPSLNFKRIHSTKPICSARVSLQYGTLGVVQGDTIVWFWIGSHADYGRLIANL